MIIQDSLFDYGNLVPSLVYPSMILLVWFPNSYTVDART